MNSKKERKISIANIFIGTGLLWVLYYIFVPLITSKFAGNGYLSPDEQKLYPIVLFSSFAVLALIVGFITGKIVKQKPLMHGLIIGITTLLFSLITLIPMNSFNFTTVSLYAISILPPVFVGSYFGSLLRRKN